MTRSIDGAECPHGINVFDPRGCAACTLQMQQKTGGASVTHANGHVPNGALEKKVADLIREKMKPTESD